MDFRQYVGPNGKSTNFLYKVSRLNNKQVIVDYEIDQASRNPETVLKKGNALPDPHLNPHDPKFTVIMTVDQFNTLAENTSFCFRPGMKGSKGMTKGAFLGAGMGHGQPEKMSSGPWWFHPNKVTPPSGVPNAPGMSTATGQRTDKPRWRAFGERLAKQDAVTAAQKQFEKDNPDIMKARKEKAAKKAAEAKAKAEAKAASKAAKTASKQVRVAAAPAPVQSADMPQAQDTVEF